MVVVNSLHQKCKAVSGQESAKMDVYRILRKQAATKLSEKDKVDMAKTGESGCYT